MNPDELPYMMIEERLVSDSSPKRIEAWLVPADGIRAKLPDDQVLLSSIPAPHALDFPETLAMFRDFVVQLATDGHHAAVGGDQPQLTYKAVQIVRQGGG